jgi:hypothetical protein
LHHRESRHPVCGILLPPPYRYLQEIEHCDRRFAERRLHHGADQRAFRRNRTRQQIDGCLRGEALDLGRIFVTDRDRPL